MNSKSFRRILAATGLAVVLGACAPAVTPLPSGVVLEGPYAKADSIALTVPSRAERAPGPLARALTRDLETDREKVRSIYRWITTNVEYDRRAFLAGDAGYDTPEDVLERRMAVCYGYSALFADLARRAGIRAVGIEGYAKGFGFVDGEGFERPNHKWNAVLVDGDWLLVDSTWGAGYMDETEWARKFDDRFFLATPDRLAFTHLPAEDEWQLLDRRVSMDEFLSTPNVPPGFERLGVSLAEVRRVVQNGEFGGFVQVYDPDGLEVSFIDIPIEKVLRTDEPYTFTVRGEEIERVVISNRSEQRPFSASGHVFSTMERLPAGQWRVLAQPVGVPYMITLLSYRVE